MSHNILFVDDDEMVRESLRRLLEDRRDDWRMNFVSSGQDALDLIKAFEYDVIVTDYMMPEMNGIELLEAIRRDPSSSSIPVVMLTGNAEGTLKRDALDAGATDLLGKPVDRDELVARLNSAIRLKTYQDSIEKQNAVLEECVKNRTAALEFSRMELVWRLGKAGEFRDSETGHHVVRVGYFTMEIAKTLGLGSQFTREIFLASPLHDIGKIGIPDSILLKPARLVEDEWAIMKRHTTIGATVLQNNIVEPGRLALLSGEVELPDSTESSNRLIEMSASIARYHHERWEGGGYPDGLAEDEIPIEALITAVADVYDALSSARPYKKAYTEERVLEIMREGAKLQFAPDVFEAFEDSVSRLRLIREHFADTDHDPQADVMRPLESLRLV